MSAIAINILGTDQSPDGKQVSIYGWPFHCMPNSGLSSGCIGTILCALLTSTLASSVPSPQSCHYSTYVVHNVLKYHH